MALLTDAVAHLDAWTIGPMQVKNGQMSIASIKVNGETPAIQLLPKERMGEITTPFEPSIYRGTGQEPRKNILFAIPEETRALLEQIETWAQTQADLKGVWHPATKPATNYTPTLKAKINETGPNACPCVDIDGKPTPMPTDWRRLAVLPIIEVRGVYSQKTGAGLVLEVVALMIGEPPTKATPGFV